MPSFTLAFVCLACASHISRVQASSEELPRLKSDGIVPTWQSQVGRNQSRSVRHEDDSVKSNQLMSFAAFLLSANPSPVTAFKPPTGSPRTNLPGGLPRPSDSDTTGSRERTHLEMLVADDVVASIEDEESIGSVKRPILKLQVKPKNGNSEHKNGKSQNEAKAEAEDEAERERNQQQAEDAMQRALRAMKEERTKQRALKEERLRVQQEKKEEARMAKQREQEEQKREREKLETLRRLEEAKAKPEQDEEEEEEEEEKTPQVVGRVVRRAQRDEDDDDTRPDYYIMSPLECESMIDELLELYGPGGSVASERFTINHNQTQACVHGLKKEVALQKKREQLDRQHKKEKKRKLTDAQFAKEVGLKGGKKGLMREMLRLSLLKKVFLKGCKGLNIWTANHYRNKGVSMEDLIISGDRGLLEAGLLHDPSLGFAFSTLAVLIMKRHMLGEIGDGASTVRLPRGVQQDYFKSLRIKKELDMDGTETELSEVADVMEKTDMRLERVNQNFAQTRTRSLNAPIGKDSDARSADRASVTEQQSEKRLAEKQAADMMSKDLENLMNEILTPRERLVLSQRFGLDDDSEEGISLVETANGLGLSVERVRQIERVALLKMNPIWN